MSNRPDTPWAVGQIRWYLAWESAPGHSLLPSCLWSLECPLCSCLWPGGNGFPLCSALLPSSELLTAVGRHISQDIPTLSPLLSPTHLCSRLRRQESEKQAHPVKSSSRACFLFLYRRVKAYTLVSSHKRAAEEITGLGGLHGGLNQTQLCCRLRWDNSFLREVSMYQRACMFLQILKQCLHHQLQRLKKKKGEGVGQGSQAFSSEASHAFKHGFRPGYCRMRFFLLTAFILHSYSMYFLRSNLGNGRSNEFTCLPGCLELFQGPPAQNTLL